MLYLVGVNGDGYSDRPSPLLALAIASCPSSSEKVFVQTSVKDDSLAPDPKYMGINVVRSEV